MSIELALPDNPQWKEFTYNGKKRIGLEFGPDSRGINCTVFFTPDGWRSFKDDKRMGEIDVTSLIVKV